MPRNTYSFNVFTYKGPQIVTKSNSLFFYPMAYVFVKFHENSSPTTFLSNTANENRTNQLKNFTWKHMDYFSHIIVQGPDLQNILG